MEVQRQKRLERESVGLRNLTTHPPDALIILSTCVVLLAPGAAHDFLRRRPHSAWISDKRWQPPSSRKELDRLRAPVWQETMAEIPSASQEAEPAQLPYQSRVGLRRAIKRLRQIMEKPQ